MTGVRSRVKRLIGLPFATRLRLAIRGCHRPRWGNVRHTGPFSEADGFGRGTPDPTVLCRTPR